MFINSAGRGSRQCEWRNGAENMSRCVVSFVVLVAVASGAARAQIGEAGCDVRARTTAGWVCGARRWAAGGARVYASFRGVPYAKPPLGVLRFKELQPAEPWSDLYDATEERDICPQTDVFYGPMINPKGMSEDCIHANIHVPLEALPGNKRLVRGLQAPLVEAQDEEVNATGLPIFVFIHGGGFAFGSGDSDVHGPEQLVANDVIVITFNYRLNVFGFLSLNSTKIPGNNGLRDMITLLKWVKDNAKYFGGNPDDVTLGGQSAGALSASLLTLSPAAKGLFKRTILMSGTANSNFYTTSPIYAKMISGFFLNGLGINSTDPDEIHQLLVEMPLEKIMQVNKFLLDQQGLAVFFPVVESPLPGVEVVIPEDPNTMFAKGYGKDIPLMIGITNMECESFRKRFKEIDVMSLIMKNPLLMAPVPAAFTFPPEVTLNKAKIIEQRYFEGSPSLDKYVKVCSDMHFEYPALKVATYRQKTDSAPTFMYQYSYDAFYSPVKVALGLNFTGAGHVEDMTNVFQVNSVPLPPNSWDDYMKGLMTEYITNFIKYSHPTCFEEGPYAWRPLDSSTLRLYVIHSPSVHHLSKPTTEQVSMLEFFDGILES